MCRNLVVEGESLFCQMQKGTIDLFSTIVALEAKVLVCEQQKCAIKDLVSQICRGFFSGRQHYNPIQSCKL
jgi:hypothetical protein